MGMDENPPQLPFECPTCQIHFQDESSLFLHTKSAHSRVLKKVIVTKRKRTWAPPVSTPVVEENKTEKNQVILEAVEPKPESQKEPETELAIKEEALEISPIFKKEDNVEPMSTDDNFDQVVNKQVEEQIEDEPSGGFLNIYEAPTSSKVSPKKRSPKIAQIQIKVVENPSRRKQRIETRRITEGDDNKKRDRSAYLKRGANCSLSSALSMKAAKMKTIMAKKLAEQRKIAMLKKKGQPNSVGDNSTKRFIYAQGRQKRKVPVQPIVPDDAPLPCDPMSIFEDLNSPPPSPFAFKEEDDKKPIVEEYSPVVKIKRKPGRPWKHGRNALLYAAGVPIPSLGPPIPTPAVDLKPPRGKKGPKTPKKNKELVEDNGEEKPLNWVGVKVQAEPEYSRSGRRRVRSTKYADFCDPSTLDDE